MLLVLKVTKIALKQSGLDLGKWTAPPSGNRLYITWSKLQGTLVILSVTFSPISHHDIVNLG